MSDTADFGEGGPSKPQSSVDPRRDHGASDRTEIDNQTAERSADHVSEVAQEAKAKVSEAVEPLQQQAKTWADNQKAAGVDKLKQVAHAIDGAASNLEGELPMTARTIREVGARPTLLNGSGADQIG